MIDMCLVDERKEDVDVEQRPGHEPSSSLNRSTSELVTGRPRDARTVNPFLEVCRPLTFAVSAARARSERTSPAVRSSRRARSFTASSTSSSIDKVVRMHLMLRHLTYSGPSCPSDDLLTGDLQSLSDDLRGSLFEEKNPLDEARLTRRRTVDGCDQFAVFDDPYPAGPSRPRSQRRW